MDNKIQTRTIAISVDTYEKLKEVCNVFQLSKATIIRMAIYHGIKRLENGYRPVRDLHKGKTEKIKIQLPEKLWELFRDTVDSIEWKDTHDELLGKALERISDGKLITMFINIEIQQYLSVIYKYNNYDINSNDSDYNKNAEKISTDDVINTWNYSNKNNRETIYITAEINDYLYNLCSEVQMNTGVLENQLWRYLLSQGLAKEYTTKETASIFTDYDILSQIDKLKIPRLKALTLIRYLIENNILIWKK